MSASAAEPHRIRLREPWRHERRGPEDWWFRAFQAPTGLGPGDGVALEVEAAVPLSGWVLNGVAERFPTPAVGFAREIAATLRPRNELALFGPAQNETPPEGGVRSVPGHVRLAITPAASP